MKEGVHPLDNSLYICAVIKVKKIIQVFHWQQKTNKQKKQEKLKEAGLKITSLFLVALTFQSEYWIHFVLYSMY